MSCDNMRAEQWQSSHVLQGTSVKAKVSSVHGRTKNMERILGTEDIANSVLTFGSIPLLDSFKLR
jgi:hypothetical protein